MLPLARTQARGPELRKAGPWTTKNDPKKGGGGGAEADLKEVRRLNHMGTGWGLRDLCKDGKDARSSPATWLKACTLEPDCSRSNSSSTAY